ncbi:carboxyltransferase domain-containing protein [Agrococcus sp. Ld7]|uniref:5-oxoprolinase subunit B/C family protein n=1 Tax=Agrococcus sp. Ld7 TaxID=649148 RepID=UPI0038688AC5
MTRVLTAADTALLLEAADLQASMRLLPALVAADLPGVTELVPGARTILVRFDAHRTTAAALRERLLAIAPGSAPSSDADPLVIPIRYDGADLEEVARLLGASPEQLVTRHLAASWTVAFMGFAPGFGYLVSDDPRFDVPRRASPRTRILAGSVGLAGRCSGIYPQASPGGWQLIGRTDLAMWDLDRDPPALLRPGTAVRFERAAREMVHAAAPRAAPVDARWMIEVVRPGAQLLVEDLGRPGLAAQGVAASGTADRASLREANRAVGNPPGAAGLEHAGGGAVLRFRGNAVIALAGARADARVLVGGRAPSLAVEHGEPVAIEDGDELRVGALWDGHRVLLAIRGGLDVEPVLGSLATDTLAQLGPAPLAAGAVLPLHGPSRGALAVEPLRSPHLPLPIAGETVEIEIVLGPRDEWFTAEATAALLGQEWLVTPHSDRVGLRLRGRTPLERAVRGELESEGTVTGAIQVPGDGQPVLFLADHPLTGGYPVIGAVVDRDLDLLGQLPPGARIRFHLAASQAAPEPGDPCRRS